MPASEIEGEVPAGKVQADLASLRNKYSKFLPKSASSSAPVTKTAIANVADVGSAVVKIPVQRCLKCTMPIHSLDGRGCRCTGGPSLPSVTLPLPPPASVVTATHLVPPLDTSTVGARARSGVLGGPTASIGTTREDLIKVAPVIIQRNMNQNLNPHSNLDINSKAAS